MVFCLRAIVSVVAATCLAGSEGANAGFLATMEVSEFANLRALIANTTKALHESQAATKLASAPKAAAAAAHDHAKTTVEKPAAPAGEAKGSLPKHVSKEREAMIIKQLSAEEAKLGENLKQIKEERKHDAKDKDKKLMSMMKGKDAEKLAGFDKFFDRMNQKSELGCQDVMSKLKRIVHFVKKGGLSGNTKAADGLNSVLKEMSGMVGL